MRWLIDTIGGLYELARLGVITKFQFRGAYWRWRMETAFGQGKPESRMEMLHAVLEYGRWMRRMRRGG